MKTAKKQPFYRIIAKNYNPLTKQEYHDMWVKDFLPFQEYVFNKKPRQLDIFGINDPKEQVGEVTTASIDYYRYNGTELEKELATRAYEVTEKLINHNMRLIIKAIDFYAKISELPIDDFIDDCLDHARRAVQRYRWYGNLDLTANLSNWIAIWVRNRCKKIASQIGHKMNNTISLDLEENPIHLTSEQKEPSNDIPTILMDNGFTKDEVESILELTLIEGTEFYENRRSELQELLLKAQDVLLESFF